MIASRTFTYTPDLNRNLLNMACEYDIETTYVHRIWFANVAPVAAFSASAAALAMLKARPHVGDRAQRPVGQVMTNERMARDWMILGIGKGANMAMYFVLPAVIIIYY